MTDPYIQINGTKIEVFDNDLSAVKSIKQLDEVTLAGVEVLTNKTYNGVRINNGAFTLNNGTTYTLTITGSAVPCVNIFIGGLVATVGAVAGQYMGVYGDGMITFHAITNVVVTWVLSTGVITVGNNTGQIFYGTIIVINK